MGYYITISHGKYIHILVWFLYTKMQSRQIGMRILMYFQVDHRHRLTALQLYIVQHLLHKHKIRLLVLSAVSTNFYVQRYRWDSQVSWNNDISARRLSIYYLVVCLPINELSKRNLIIKYIVYNNVLVPIRQILVIHNLMIQF